VSVYGILFGEGALSLFLPIVLRFFSLFDLSEDQYPRAHPIFSFYVHPGDESLK